MDESDLDKPQDNKGQKKSARQHDGGAADLEKVTDYEEERVVLSQDITGVNVQTMFILRSYINWILVPITQAINKIDNRRSKEEAERQAKERELAKVSIKKEDVEVLVNFSQKKSIYLVTDLVLLLQLKETEIPRTRAERILRENKGDLVSALRQVINS